MYNNYMRTLMSIFRRKLTSMCSQNLGIKNPVCYSNYPKDEATISWLDVDKNTAMWSLSFILLSCSFTQYKVESCSFFNGY